MNILTSSFPLRDLTLGRAVIQISLGGVGTGPWDLYGPHRDKTMLSVLNIASAFGMRSLLVPDVTDFNGRITSSRFMTLRHGKGVDLYHESHADGVVLDKGQAVAFATGDCPTVVMYEKTASRLVVAHVGRESLLGTFPKPRSFSLENNVLSMMFKEFDFRKIKPENIHVYVMLGIAGGHFTHPINHPNFGTVNREMLKFVREKFGSHCIFDHNQGSISLFDIIRTQCQAKGIPFLNIRSDSVDTFTDKDPRSGEYLYYSNRRGDKKRNLVFISLS